ncbi:CPBP family intramembrane metalloprotease [Blastococcus sp. CT_GayMR19]|uniref:CPBP family intramembrane glutamic endopeptidase n=1 Tax=Blastococcus sp. CT_GayMR19 TaxID=2559608 RepID=UPI0010747AF4|nr:CPBP family intramembrane glutamic endopeptidase [Blastococcus sp. CT_GayMR19]TFV73320.1 CPBP family intramembrane metalloprotease [Blastococcus sp. CT_GayMR19]
MSAVDDFQNTGGGPAGTAGRPDGPRRRPARGFRAFAARRPVTAFLVVALPLGWALLAVPALTFHGVLPGGEIPSEPFALALTLLVMLPTALWVVSVTDGRAGVRALLARAVRWRFGLGWWAVVVLGMPVTSVAVGAGLGRFVGTGDLAGALVDALVFVLVAVVVINLWEETVWAGFVQTRLEPRYGLLPAALLTALGFAAIHLPMLFATDLTASSVLVGIGVLLIAAVVLRLLIGMVLGATAGSVLAVAVLHATWNASQSEGQLVDTLLSGGQPVLEAVLAVTLLAVAAALVLRPRPGPVGPHGEESDTHHGRASATS